MNEAIVEAIKETSDPLSGVTGDPTISVANLKHTFGSGDNATRVLEDIELDIFPGEIVIMTGPSGSGKTTLLTLIAGLRSVQEGSVRVLGTEMRGLSGTDLVKVRRRIGFIFQRHNLFESLTAHQNVRLAIELNEPIPSDRDQRATAMLEKLFWREEERTRAHFKPEQLSGGQRQRVAIARALVNDPKLVLADEPTAALDEVSGNVVMDLLQEMAQRGSTILIVTHDNRILERADRIVSMAKGKIVTNVLVKETLQLVGYLRRCVLFASLTADEIAEIAQKMKKQTYSPGELIVQQGEPGDEFYLIRSGEVDVVVNDGQVTKVVNILKEGDYFGERSLMTGEPRNATIRTRNAVVAYALGDKDFQVAKEAATPFVEQLRRVFVQRQ